MSSVAVFLDRDGVINLPVVDPGSGLPESPYRPEDVTIAPGAIEALELLRTLEVPLVVVSNQPAAAKGTATRAALEAVHEEVVAQLAAAGLELDAWRYCLHHPEGGDPELGRACTCRKPAPGLLLGAAADLGVDDLAGSWLIGDSSVDVEAGRAAGCRTILVEEPLTAHRRTSAAADVRVRDLWQAAGVVVRSVRDGAERAEGVT